MRVSKFFTLLAVLSGVAFGQTTETKPAFHLAAVYPGTEMRYPAARVSLHAGRLEIRSATLVDLITNAWGAPADKVLGGPSWLDTDRFDVIAGVAANTTPQMLRPMLQTLLSERFNLIIHTDQRPAQAYVLSKGNGEPKIKRSDVSDGAACQRQPQSDETAAIPAICRGMTMEQFARQLQQIAGDYLQSPVVDDTNLEGSWDLTLKWTPRNRLAVAGGDAITIFDAIDKQLGLKLQSKQVPTPVIVVDHANRKPTPNLPDAEAGLPPSPQPEFEVATIKPVDPGFQGVNIQTPPNGLVRIQGLTLGLLVQSIWFITPQMIVGAPEWFDTQRWDISGKISSTPGAAPQTDLDSMIGMVRALLEDRFRLKTHTEERTVPAYTLTAEKPRLREADPANRTGCKEGPAAGGRDPRITNPAMSRLVSCQNMTMAEFATRLPGIANRLNQLNGPIRSTVLDSTGLQGAWDFTVNFSPEVGISPGGAPAPPTELASSPDGKLSLSEALARQLGLRLELTKRPLPNTRSLLSAWRLACYLSSQVFRIPSARLSFPPPA
jgi:uncharacterized protein (TIGR03435 family)